MLSNFNQNRPSIFEAFEKATQYKNETKFVQNDMTTMFCRMDLNGADSGCLIG